jgi:DNA invertase Pin-like site-specific DNA recombinase
MGREVIRVYKHHGISGAMGRDKRPAFDAMCRDATQRRFDVIMAWSVDRLGRSLQDLVAFLSEIHALRIDMYLHQQGPRHDDAGRQAMFQMMGVFAEFERAMIQERVRAGLARARSEGKQMHQEGPGDSWAPRRAQDCYCRQRRDCLGLSVRIPERPTARMQPSVTSEFIP